MEDNIFISAVETTHMNNLDVSQHGRRDRREFTILKIRGARDSYNSDNVDMQVRPMELMYRSNLVYSVKKKQFVKNRFDINGCNSAVMLPESINPLFSAVIDVNDELPIETLRENHSKSLLLEALFLTNKIRVYRDDFSLTEYQLMRYRYGKEINHSYLVNVVEEFPELLI